MCFLQKCVIPNILDLMTGLVRGMSIQKGEAWDEVFAEDIVNHLFEVSRNDKASAMDLIALNMQRGRDHGIPGYNSYREECGYKKATTFEDLRDHISAGKIHKIFSIFISNIC